MCHHHVVYCKVWSWGVCPDLGRQDSVYVGHLLTQLSPEPNCHTYADTNCMALLSLPISLLVPRKGQVAGGTGSLVTAFHALLRPYSGSQS